MRTFSLVAILLLIVGCSEQKEVSKASVDIQKQLLEQMIMAQPGDVIEIPAGTHEMTRSLSLKVNDITLRGAGMEASVLSFRNQTQGAEGMIITGDNILLEGFAVEDAKGDAIKINECTNLTIRDVRVEWTNGPDKDNGAYGLYPVQCENVLIDASVAIGASDAGIYVGQSNQVIVKNSRAEFNVAGIEIENTTNADVLDNIVTNNTGGILVFNMPNLPQSGSLEPFFMLEPFRSACSQWNNVLYGTLFSVEHHAVCYTVDCSICSVLPAQMESLIQQLYTAFAF